MLHKRGAEFLLPDVLARLGVAVMSDSGPDLVDRIDNAMAQLWRRTPARVQRALAGARERVRGWIDGRDPSVTFNRTVRRLDAARSRCFLLGNGFPISGLRLNRIGREPAGLIRPGAEEEASARS